MTALLLSCRSVPYSVSVLGALKKSCKGQFCCLLPPAKDSSALTGPYEGAPPGLRYTSASISNLLLCKHMLSIPLSCFISLIIEPYFLYLPNLWGKH